MFSRHSVGHGCLFCKSANTGWVLVHRLPTSKQGLSRKKPPGLSKKQPPKQKKLTA